MVTITRVVKTPAPADILLKDMSDEAANPLFGGVLLKKLELARFAPPPITLQALADWLNMAANGHAEEFPVPGQYFPFFTEDEGVYLMQVCFTDESLKKANHPILTNFVIDGGDNPRTPEVENAGKATSILKVGGVDLRVK